MSEFDLSFSTKSVWSDGFVMELTLVNTGSEPLTDMYVDIVGTAEITEGWRGSYTQLDDGTYRIYFGDVNIAPGETATFRFKAQGEPDFELVETDAASDPVDPVADPDPVDPVTDPDPVDPVAGPDPVDPVVEPDPTEPVPDTGPVDPVTIPDPGNALPDGPTVVVDLDVSAADLEAMIAEADAGTVFQLQAGTYHFDRTITIERSDIALVGAGSGRTVIEVPSDLNQEAFAIGDGGRSGSFSLAADVGEGSARIVLDGSHSFEAGDYVYLARESTEAFYDSIGDETWRNTDVPLRTSIVRVESVDGNTLTLAGGVHFDFTVSETTVQEIDMVENVTLGGFEIDYGLGRADPSQFANTLSGYDRDAVIQVEGTSWLTLFDLVARDVPSMGVNFALSTGVSADGIEITGAHNKGDGGNGYAVQIRDVYDSSFVNLTDMDMRHSVVFASWRSAADNLVHVTLTDRDINFHGGRDHGNVVMVDQSIRDAESDIISPTLFVNTEGTHYGSVTDADANTVRFGHVVGTRLADAVQGYDGGSWLDGQGGNDSLTGGEGNDVLVGGEGRDLLVGGGAEDIALYTGNYADFRITDLGGGMFEVDDRAGSQSRDTVDVEWLAFDDGALRLSDMAFLDLSAIDDVFGGAAVYDPQTGDQPAGTEPVGTEPVPDEPVTDEPDTSGGSAPVLHGTDGKDTFSVTVEGTTVVGYGNWDFVKSSVDFTMSDDVEKLELVGTLDIDAEGSGSDDLMLGNDARNVIDGNGGNDQIWARNGDDVLSGGDGNDQLSGGGGNDLLRGDAGIDHLTGESGADTFQFIKTAESAPGAMDVIADFVSGTDAIDLAQIDANSKLSGNQSFVWQGSGAGAIWVDDGKLLGDTNGDGGADFAIDLLGASLVEADLLL